MCYAVGGKKEANINFSTNRNRKLSDIPASVTLPVDRYVDVHVTGSELIGVESNEPLHVLRMSGNSESDDNDGDDDEDDNEDDDNDDCAVEFEAVEPFQPQSTIQAFTSILGDKAVGQTTVWLLIDINLLKLDKLSVDETSLLDSQFTDGDPLELLGINYTAVRLELTGGFHVVAAVSGASDVTPQLDLFQYIYVPKAGRGYPPPCVARVLCGHRDRVSPSATPEFSAGDDVAALNGGTSSLIDSYPSDETVSSAWRQHNWSAEAAGSGDRSAASGVSPDSARIDTDEPDRADGRTTTQTASDLRGPNNSQVTATIHQRVDADIDKTATPARNKTSADDLSASAPAPLNVPYVLHPMASGDRPAESYVVKLGKAADDLAASGPQGPPVWRSSDHDGQLTSEPVSPTVIAVLTSLGVAIFFVIVCILGFVVSELVCGESGYGRARLLGKHGARVSPYYGE